MTHPDPTPIAGAFKARDQFAVVERFLDAGALEPLLGEANAMRARINRNFVPMVKKGGSVSAFDIRKMAPAVWSLYTSPALISWLSAVTGEQLLTCPDNDPHACALYYYTQAGDYISWHFDTSFYRGKRFTVLIGLVQQSKCELVAQLYKRDPARTPEEVHVATHPGTLVVFDGDRVWHCVTPSQEGDDRIVLSLEYVTDRRMGFFPRIVSTVKDAVAYFGIRGLLRGAR